MVLQNKYKARASRRYQAARGGGAARRGGRAGPGRDGAPGGGGERGWGAQAQNPASAGPPADAAATLEASDGARGEAGDEPPASFARRRLEANTWRYEEESDEGAESEPDVDLAALRAKVASLDVNAPAQGQLPDSAEEEEDAFGEPCRPRAQEMQVLAQEDWEARRRDKEAADAARALKERFETRLHGAQTAAPWRRVQGTQVSVRPRRSRAAQLPDAKATVRSAERVQMQQGSTLHTTGIASGAGTPHAAVRAARRAPHADVHMEDIDDLLASIDGADAVGEEDGMRECSADAGSGCRERELDPSGECSAPSAPRGASPPRHLPTDNPLESFVDDLLK
ncbi:hypothetical protein MSPP1_001169 [Malassezia sp. CBS 17886]|nr:hypothetical protein MSPP1_001169 [Malassezia sp. CBS 17886]